MWHCPWPFAPQRVLRLLKLSKKGKIKCGREKVGKCGIILNKGNVTNLVEQTNKKIVSYREDRGTNHYQEEHSV